MPNIINLQLWLMLTYLLQLNILLGDSHAGYTAKLLCAKQITAYLSILLFTFGMKAQDKQAVNVILLYM